MTGENVSDSLAEFACGQLLFNLKNSKLNYLVRETPYSAYITIRKTLLKSFDKEAFKAVTNNTSATIMNVKNVEKENSRLKERNLDLEREHALLKIEYEQIEQKFNDLKDIKNELDEKTEDLLEENEKLQKCNATFANDLEKERGRSKLAFDQNKREESKEAKEKKDLIDILEVTVENKNSEVNDLREKLSKAFDQIEILKSDSKVQHSFSCQTCDYKASTDND